MKKILPLLLFIAFYHASSAQKLWPQEQLNRLWAQRNPELLEKYAYLRPVSNYLAFCTQNGKTGLVDSTGKVILKPLYNFGHRYEGTELLIVGANDKRGAFNLHGKQVLPLKYTRILPLKTLIWATTATDTLLFTAQCKRVNNPKLEQVLTDRSKENNGYFSASAGSQKWGIVDSQGNWVIQPEFNYVDECYKNDVYWIGATDTGKVLLHPATQWRSSRTWNTIQVITPNGFWAKKEDENTFSFFNFEEKKVSGVLELDHPGHSSTFRIVEKDEKKGLMTADTTMALSLVFENIRIIWNYYSPTTGYEVVFAVKDTAGERLFDGENWLSPKSFRWVERYRNSQIIGFTADSAFIYNEKGAVLQALNLPDGKLLNKKWLVSKINRDSVWHIDLGWIKVPGDAYEFYGVKEGLIIHYTYNSSSLMNDAGKIVLEHADAISNHFGIFGGSDMEADWGMDMGIIAKTKNESIQYQKGILYGWAMADGSHTEPASYERIINMGSGSFVVQKNLLYGLVSVQGEVLVPIEYTDQKTKQWGENRTVFLKKGTFWYLFDAKTGKQLTSEKLLGGTFDCSTGLSWGLTATGWQVFHSTTGKPILPTPVPEVIQGCYRGYVYKKNEKYGVIGLDGKVLVPFEWDTIVNCKNPPWGYKSGKISVWSGEFNRKFETEAAELRVNEGFITIRRDSLWYLIRPESSTCSTKGYKNIVDLSVPIGQSDDHQWDVLSAYSQECTTLTADTLLLYARGFMEVQNGIEHYIYQLSSGKKIPFRYEKVEELHPYFLTKNGAKQGLVDANLREILPCKYSNIRVLDNDPNFILTTLNDSTGLYYKDGSVCIPEDNYEPNSFRSPDRVHYSFMKGGQTGYYSKSKRQWTFPVVDLIYPKEELIQLTQDLFKIRVNGWYGIMDQKNQSVLPPEYNSIDKYFKSETVLLRKGGKCQRFNPTTRQLDTTLYDDIRIGVNGFALCKVGIMNYLYKNDQLVFKKDSQQMDLLHRDLIRFRDPVTHLYGVLDTAGRVLQRAELEWIDFEEYDSKILFAQKGGKTGAFSLKMELVLPFEFNELQSKRGIGYLLSKNNKMGFYDEEGLQILPPQFETIKVGENATHFVADSDGLFRFYDRNGQLLHNTTWEDANVYSDGLAAVKKDGLWGYINVNGQVIIPLEYQYASKFNARWGLKDALVVTDHQYKVIDKDGHHMDKISLKDIFSTDNWYSFEPKLQIESPSNTRAYTENPFEKIGSGNGYLVAKSWNSGKVGLVDFLGEWAILPQYADIRMNDSFHYRQALACVSNGTKWALLGRDLKPIGDFQYDSIAQSGDGLFLVKKGKNAFKIDEKGAVVR